MIKKLMPALAAAAVLWLLPNATHAASVAPVSQFRNQLQQRLSGASGARNVRITAALLGRYARMNPALTPQFASLARSFIRRSVSPNAYGTAVITLVRQLSVNYFRGAGVYLPKSPQFVRALRIVLNTVPAEQLTPTLRLRINTQIDRVNAVLGGNEQDAEFLRDIIDGTNVGPTPVS